MSTVRRTASAAGHRDRVPAPRRAIKAALPTLTDRAYDALEEMIVTLQLAPGSAASEAELSQWLGIGRTPIREALQRLSRDIAGQNLTAAIDFLGSLSQFEKEESGAA